MNDPRHYLDNEKMSRLQITVVAITIMLNAIDGFDVLSISFAAPGIANEWGIPRASLGVVMAMELIGMAIGSFFLGGVADKFGRRPTVLGCLITMSAGMFLVTTATSAIQLSVWRIMVGLGIGGILSCVNAVVAEFSNIQRRGMCISLMVIGYPLGGTFGGMIASHLLQAHDWRAIFYFGAAVTGILVPVVYFLVPESVHWLVNKRPKGALEKINAGLARMKFPAIEKLPERQETERKKPLSSIFSRSIFPVTLILTMAYFLHITTFYFILKWSPKVVADMGFSPALAGGVLVWASMGGALGGAAFGWLTTRISLKKLTVLIMVLTSVFVSVFGRTGADLSQIKLLAAFAGFFANAGISGLYSLLAVAFPTDVRATGTGFVIGVGRAGAVLSPILAGVFLQFGAKLPSVALAMSLGSLLAALLIFFPKTLSANHEAAGKTV
ncbi:benzoate transport [Desulfosalsimonas propionicica]|uniref:Benzoate transport n=1 Tax=Desulfosalsimonas propionicica TaxID=332175 RepID=A0A7W0CBZ6_9BACT|nr:MFS transporter [Desulfosalsimonas propionicica]MBA2882925.1 benzoate transport [Desulfosalsimonas propionicica]